MDLRPSPPSALQMKSEAVHHVDYAVVGCGVAGLRGAIELCAAGSVLVLAKSDLSDSATNWAQGGIAAALSDDDEVSLHEQDTIQAGDGLCRTDAVKTLVEEGPAYIQQLIEWGTQFDRAGTKLAFTREAAHSRSRILHAQGDSTGREIGPAPKPKRPFVFAPSYSPPSFWLRKDASPVCVSSMKPPGISRTSTPAPFCSPPVAWVM